MVKRKTVRYATGRVLVGSCLDRLRDLPDGSIDSIVTDPPYELGFMGKAWDASGIAYSVEMWQECLRVLKPGGHLLAFGGTRTYHRMAVAIEDAGFEIRDSIHWIYGSGFPKSLDVSKAIDKQRHDRAEIYEVTAWIRAARDAAGLSNRDIDAAFGFSGMAGHWTSAKSQPAVPTLDQVPQLLDVLGLTLDDVPNEVRNLLWELNGKKGQPGPNWAKREVLGKSDELLGRKSGIANGTKGHTTVGGTQAEAYDITAPATDAAKTWQGWGTALKPAHEPIVVARKPLDGTVAANVLAHGTGALNIDGCRIGDEERTYDLTMTSGNFETTNGGKNEKSGTATVTGRWPSNVIFDEEAGFELDAQSGIEASRFFYCPKPSRSERNAGLDGIEGKSIGAKGNGLARTCSTCKSSVIDGCECPNRTFENPIRLNFHPTVKPVALIRYLVRLVTPPGGVVLDPFLGSGTTAVAAIAEGFAWVGCEVTPDYLPVIAGRVRHANKVRPEHS
jgi:DNA modification methylase